MPEEYPDILAGGDWVTGHSGDLFEDRNPADRDDLIALFARGDDVDVDEAVRAARAASETWAATPAPRRADYVLRAGLLMEQRKEELAQLMSREMGKTLPECRADVQEGIDLAFYMA